MRPGAGDFPPPACDTTRSEGLRRPRRPEVEGGGEGLASGRGAKVATVVMRHGLPWHRGPTFPAGTVARRSRDVIRVYSKSF